MSDTKVMNPTSVTSTVTFVDDEGTATDPSGIIAYWMDPAGNVTPYTYAVGGEVIRDAVGVYHMDLVADVVGTWWVRWLGVGLTTQEDYFVVTDTHVPTPTP